MSSPYQEFCRGYNRPIACFYTRFDGVYTHYTSLKKSDGEYGNIPANILQQGNHPECLFTSLVNSIKKYCGDEFFLNEYIHAVEEPIQHRLFIDIDMNPSNELLEGIKMAMEELTAGQYTQQIARNESSGKVHLITNIAIFSDDLKSVYRFLKKYLFDFVSDEVTAEEWKKFFDSSAPGIRSIHSIKIKEGVESTSTYSPADGGDARLDFAKKLWKWSIYNLESTTYFKSEVLDLIEQTAAPEFHAPDCEYIATNKLLPIFNQDLQITSELVNNLVKCLAPNWKNGKNWFVACVNVKNATQYLTYDPTWLLAEWSSGGEGFNAQNNIATYSRFRVTPEKFAEALAFLRAMAFKGNRHQLRLLIHPVPAISDRNVNIYYIDHEKIAQCPQADRGNQAKYISVIRSFIINTMALVHNGGNSFWVTKNLLNGEIEYNFVNRYSKSEKNFTTEFIIDWERVKDKKGNEVDVPITTSLLTQALAISRDISYSRLDFLPYAKISDLKNPERVFNQFTGLVSDHEFVPLPNYNEELERIIYHMKVVLCNGDEPSYQYLICWLAHIVQKPHQKNGVAILIRSSEGSGKSSFWEFFGKFVLGAKFYLPAQMKKVVKKFNSICANNLLTVFEETKDGEGAKYHEDLKQMITDEIQIIEPKGVNSYKTLNYSNYVVLTNDHYPVTLTANDRRFFCLESNDSYKSDWEYHSKLREHIMTEGEKYGKLFYEFLCGVDIVDWNPRPIETKLRRDLKLASLPLPIQFLLEVIKGNVVGIVWKEEKTLNIHSDELYNHFRVWEQDQDIRGKTTKNTFCKKLNEIKVSEKIEIENFGMKKRAMGFKYIREELVAALKKYLNDPDFDINVETEQMPEPDLAKELNI